MNIGLIIYILNSINSIMRFLERRDYTYWTHKIHSKFKIYTHLTLINAGGGRNHPPPSENRVFSATEH